MLQTCFGRLYPKGVRWVLHQDRLAVCENHPQGVEAWLVGSKGDRGGGVSHGCDEQPWLIFASARRLSRTSRGRGACPLTYSNVCPKRSEEESAVKVEFY